MSAPSQTIDPGLQRIVRWNLYLAFLALALGLVVGLYQALERAGLDLYHTLPLITNYYQGLTLHGVANVLVFTFAFINGFMTFVVAHALRRPLAVPALTHASFWVQLLGVALALWAIFANQATVLFTFYPPMKAHPAYYLGLTLVVASTWLTSLNLFLSAGAWSRAHRGQPLPLAVYGVVATYVMWDLATLGVAAEMIFQLLPWSFGLVQGVDPQLARTLFWFTGHPIVYFWLLPAYVSWYTMMPAQVGGKLLSDPLARLAFLLFVLLSTPVGFHHQFADPGIPESWKAVHAVFTFAVFFPSLMTAFSVVASLEIGGRRRGGRGLVGWVTALPWGDPSVAAQLLAMLVFTLGGVSGLINASYVINLMVHNTSFVPGHFHLTVGTAVALTFMGVTYWLLPHLTGRALWGRKLALVQAWLWAIGMLIFARGQMWAGIEGMPRRTAIAVAPYVPLRPEWAAPNGMTAIGGLIVFVSGVLFLLVVVMTVLAGRRGAHVPVPEAEPLVGTAHAWPWLERWRLWVAAAVLLVAVAYGPYLIGYLPHSTTQIGFRVW